MTYILNKIEVLVASLLDDERDISAIDADTLNVDGAWQQIFTVAHGDGDIVLGQSAKFDSIKEVIAYQSQWQSAIQLNFSGEDAYQHAVNFINLVNSEKSGQLQQNLAVTLGNIDAITYPQPSSEQPSLATVQLNFTVTHAIVTDVKTLRIDEAQFNFLENK